MSSETEPTIGVVGANGQVGRELCVALRGPTDPVPIVRNKLSASFFEHHGFDYRVGDITSQSDAEQVLRDLDVLVVAARANPGGLTTHRAARRTNEQMLENAVTLTPNDTTVVFFSSIAAFGSQLYTDASDRNPWSAYRLEKRHCENTLAEVAGPTDDWYAFRLGHVFGKTQGRTETIREFLGTHDRATVEVPPSRASNVLQIPVLAGAIVEAHRQSVTSGTYTLTNDPQWTWEEVIQHYAPSGTQVRFDSRETDSGLVATVVQRLKSTVLSNKDHLMPLLYYVPESLNERIAQTYVQQSAGTAVQSYEERQASRRRLHLSIFEYNPAPGEQFHHTPGPETAAQSFSDETGVFETEQ